MSRTAYSPNVERQQFRATALSMPSLHNFPNSTQVCSSLTSLHRSRVKVGVNMSYAYFHFCEELPSS